jgi:hypothetical protein
LPTESHSLQTQDLSGSTDLLPRKKVAAKANQMLVQVPEIKKKEKHQKNQKKVYHTNRILRMKDRFSEHFSNTSKISLSTSEIQKILDIKTLLRK